MRRPRFAVIVFPGSNCDHDAYYVVKKIMNCEVKFIWHQDSDLKDVDVVILPGGFSYGDYLRSGAIASFSKIMNEVISFGKKGGTIIGICNGFQVLTESGLLPGALHKNDSLKFVCKFVNLKVMTNGNRFTNLYAKDEVLKFPIAHGDGNYFAPDDILKSLEENNQIVFKYCDEFGQISDESNPNGSLYNIAGIVNKERNILGLMPHPERVCDPLLGSTDGLNLFNSIIKHFSKL